MASSDPYEVDGVGFWRPSTIVAAIILVLVLVAGVALVILRATGGNSTAATSPVPGASAVSASPATGGPSSGAGCSVPSGSQTVPDTTPQGISWDIYQTVALPYSKAAGPEKTNGDLASCYAHDPVGALIAATQLSFRLVLAPSTDVASQQVVPGAGQTAFITADKQAMNTSGGGASAGSFDQVAGFKYVTYSPSVAVIELATQSSSGSLQASTITVEWMNGDWRLVLQPNGDTTPTILPLSSIVGYSTWAGV